MPIGGASRLPSDAEWQVAMEQYKIPPGEHAVWNWTANEYLSVDGRTRFCLLKGGCTFEAKGSEWYADGGVHPANFAAKFIEYWPGLDRNATIGFRCAASAFLSSPAPHTSNGFRHVGFDLVATIFEERGRARCSPSDSRLSSLAKPGPSVASSNRMPPGSRK